MESQTERDHVRKPYEPPALRELGKVAEVTFGVDLAQGIDDAILSAPL